MPGHLREDEDRQRFRRSRAHLPHRCRNCGVMAARGIGVWETRSTSMSHPIRSAFLGLALISTWSAAHAASEADDHLHYGGSLTMACGTSVVALDLSFGRDGTITGTAAIGTTSMPVTGRLGEVAGKTTCSLNVQPGILVGTSTAPKTAFTFEKVTMSNTGKKDKPRRLHG